MNGRRLMRRAAFATPALLALLAGCAPRPTAPVAVTAGDRRQRFERARAAREAAAMTEMWVTLWPRAAAGGLPGFDAQVTIAAPSAFRFRVASLFGTAFDISARGDSIVGWVPSRREGAAVDAGVDPVGVRAPGRFGVWLFAGEWRPPDEAWARAVWRDSLLELAWREGADSLAVAIGPSGQPREARAWQEAGADAQGLEVSYTDWQHAGGAQWPQAFEIRDLENRLTVRARVDRVRVSPRPDWDRLAVALPAGTRLVPWSELSRRFRRVLQEMP